MYNNLKDLESSALEKLRDDLTRLHGERSFVYTPRIIIVGGRLGMLVLSGYEVLTAPELSLSIPARMGGMILLTHTFTILR
jgi:hypothetical protein